MSPGRTPAESGYLATPPPAPATPWRHATFTVLDFELTGLDPARDEIVSFATVTVSQGRIRLDDARHALVRPRRMPDAETIRIHGLREVDLAGAPTLEESLDDLLEALTGRALVAHVAAIEEAYLRAALGKRGLSLANPVIDTAAVARHLRRVGRRGRRQLSTRMGSSARGPEAGTGLSQLARSLGLPVHRPHHADGDALTTAQVFLALATHLEALEPVSVSSLAGISSPSAPLAGGWRRLVDRLRPGVAST